MELAEAAGAEQRKDGGRSQWKKRDVELLHIAADVN